jgi:hypothetical protein
VDASWLGLGLLATCLHALKCFLEFNIKSPGLRAGVFFCEICKMLPVVLPNWISIIFLGRDF